MKHSLYINFILRIFWERTVSTSEWEIYVNGAANADVCRGTRPSSGVAAAKRRHWSSRAADSKSALIFLQFLCGRQYPPACSYYIFMVVNANCEEVGIASRNILVLNNKIFTFTVHLRRIDNRYGVIVLNWQRFDALYDIFMVEHSP